MIRVFFFDGSLITCSSTSGRVETPQCFKSLECAQNFSEESSRMVYEMGSMKLFEQRHISVTTQFHSCLKHVPEGLKFCGCGVCLRQDEDTMARIKARFKALISPYYVPPPNSSRGKDTEMLHGNKIIGKQGTP